MKRRRSRLRMLTTAAGVAWYAGLLVSLRLGLIAAVFGQRSAFLVGEAWVLLPVAGWWLLGLWQVPWTRWPSRAPSCHRCGYDLTGNRSGSCPECGHDRFRDPTRWLP